MKIGFFADGPWSHKALEYIKETGDVQISFIVARHPSPDPILRDWSIRLNVPFYVTENINCESFINQVRHRSDLNVSLSFDQIIKDELINLAPLKFINCHAGALPFYRGRNILNWAIINGETNFAVTVHYVDKNIDSGDIIIQDIVPIETYDDYGSILQKAYKQCALSLVKAMVAIKNGKLFSRSQKEIHPIGFYCGRRVQGDEWINWNNPSILIHNFIRGISKPGPCARTLLNAKEIAICKSNLINDAPSYICTPGEVVGKSEAGSIVKTGDSTILIKSVADCNGIDISNERLARFKIGTRFGFNPFMKITQLEKRIKDLEMKKPME